MDNYYLFNYISTIKETIEKNNVVSIVCPPGSGEGLVIPYSIIDMERIVVVFDSDEAITSVFKYFQKNYPQINIGYHLSTDEAINDDTRLVFYHVKSIANIFIKSNRNGQCSDISDINVIIFTDIQNFNIEKYIIFNIWNICQNKVVLPKLVISGNYIPLGLIKESVVLNYPGRSKPIVNHWINEDIHYENPTLIKEITKTAVQYFTAIQHKGNFLILIPSGDKTIELKKQLMAENLTWNIVSVNDGEIPIETTGSTGTEDIQSAVRQIFLCDWSNRHVVNGNSLILVIDSCISDTKNRLITNSKLIDSDQLTNHSKLIGIKHPGIFQYMISKNRYLTQMNSPSSKIFFQKEPSLGRWILKLEKNGINPITIFYDNDSHPLVGPVDISLEYHNIINYKLIDQKRKKLTDVGNFLINLPLSIKNGYILYNLLKQDFSFIISIVVVSFLETGFRFGFPKRSNEMTDSQYRQNLFNYQNRYFSHLRQKSNIGTAVAIWDKMNREIRNKNIPSIYEWSKRNGIHSSDLIKFHQLMESLKTILNIKVKHEKMIVELSQDIDEFFKRFDKFIPKLIPFSIMEYLPEKDQYYDYINKKLFIQSYYSVSQLTTRNAPYIIALSTSNIGNLDLIDFSYPLDTLTHVPSELIGFFNIPPEIIKTVDERSRVIVNPDPRINQALNILSLGDYHEDQPSEHQKEIPWETKKKMLIASRILSASVYIGESAGPTFEERESSKEMTRETTIKINKSEQKKLLDILGSR